MLIEVWLETAYWIMQLARSERTSKQGIGSIQEAFDFDCGAEMSNSIHDARPGIM
jgi:hypothetical protein